MNDNVVVLGLYTPTSQIGGRVMWTGGVAPTVMAGTHGYGFGYILVDEEARDRDSLQDRETPAR